MSRTTKRPLTGAKRIDHTCRNHGTCSYCQGNRTIATTKQANKAAYND